jgi:hypothetical protein
LRAPRASSAGQRSGRRRSRPTGPARARGDGKLPAQFLKILGP